MVFFLYDSTNRKFGANFHSEVKWKKFPTQSYIYCLPLLKFEKQLSSTLFGLFLVSYFFSSKALKIDLLLQHNIHNWDIFNELLTSLSILFCVGTVKYFHVSYSLPMWSMDFQINAMSNTVKTFYIHLHIIILTGKYICLIVCIRAEYIDKICCSVLNIYWKC